MAETNSESCKERYRRMRAEGRCVVCTEPSDTRKCKSCIAKAKSSRDRRRDNRKQMGLCTICGKTSFMDSQKDKVFAKCEECYLKRNAHEGTGKRSNWTILKQLFEDQDGKCAYTGVPIILGGNADMDHIVPTSVDPSRRGDPDNWQWVHNTVNVMKGGLTEGALFSIVTRIYEGRLNANQKSIPESYDLVQSLDSFVSFPRRGR